MNTRKLFVIAFLIIGLAVAGCSGGGNVTAPVETPVQPKDTSADSHTSWGMWEFVCDPAEGTVEVVQLREADLHLNAINFVEPPPLVFLTLESAPHFSGGVLDVDIGLRHPFLGLNQYTGFDVCGILISHGSVSGFAVDATINLPGEGDTRLLNADGFTRWWNPTEFPYNAAAPIAGYKDGILGTPDDTANFDATLNGYKYFTDDLDPNSPLTMVDTDSRGLFSAGQKNIRHYTIDMGSSFTFNYAVDANWKFPVGDPPYQVPDDFDPNANRPEAWNITVAEIENTLAYELGEGYGHLSMLVDVYDWFDAGLNMVHAESLSGIPMVSAVTPIGGGMGYSTYELDLMGETLNESGEIDILISVESDKAGYQGLLPGKAQMAHFIHTTTVAEEIPQYNYMWVFDDEQTITDGIDHDRDPTINQPSAYQIDIGYLRITGNSSGSTATGQMLMSTDSGVIFEYQWTGNSYHGGQYLDDMKVSTDPYGNSVFHYQSWIISTWTIGSHAAAVRYPSFPAGQNNGLILCNSEKSNEITWTSDEMLLSIADKDSVIRYKKGNIAGSCQYDGTWTGWQNAPLVTLVDEPARISETRSVIKDDDGAIHLAYYGGEEGVWIRMISSSSGDGTTWDSDVYITEGLTEEFSSRIEPSIAIGPLGEFHASFIGVLGDMHTILYATSVDGTVWGNYMPITSNVDGPIEHVTIDAFPFLDTTIIIISYMMDDDIWLVGSFDSGVTFHEPIMVSDGTGKALEPDILADDEGYVHIAWSHLSEEVGDFYDYDIHYRRAHLEEEE